MSLFERFAETKEEGFREDFIQPLLVKLGFVNISNKHGSQEFGKDYVFSEIDRFAHYRHMVVQAKHEESINQGRKVDDLLSQVRQAFTVPYSLPSAHHEVRRVSAVYVFNTGTITDNATTQIANGLTDPAARCNVHFFDGAQLEIIANSTDQQDNEVVRRRLKAMNVQLTINDTIMSSLLRSLDLPANEMRWDVRELLRTALDAYSCEPFATIDLNLVFGLLQRYSIIGAIVHKYYGANIGIDGPGKTMDLSILKQLCTEALRDMHNLQLAVGRALESLPAVTI